MAGLISGAIGFGGMYLAYATLPVVGSVLLLALATNRTSAAAR